MEPTGLAPRHTGMTITPANRLGRAAFALTALTATALGVVVSMAALPAYADEAPISGSYLTVPNVAPFEEGELVTADFEDGQIRVQGTCNTMGGTTTWVADQLTVGELASTLMGCDDDSMAEDQWLANWLGSRLTYSPNGELFTLSDGTTSLSFEPNRMLEASGAPGLKHTSWVLQSYRQGAATPVRVSKTSPVTLQIKSKQLRFTTGCNQAWGPVAVRAGRLNVGAVSMTRMGCAGSAARLEKQVLATIKGVVSARQNGSRLVLRRGDNVLVYRAA